MSEHPLYRIMNPRSVVFVGASNNIETMGTVHLNSLLEDGFDGKIFAVHPTEKEVLGQKTYADLELLPETPDLIVMVVNRDLVLPIIEKAGKIGIKHAVIITGGFAESADNGPDLQDALYKAVKKYGITVIGPNCIGVVNPWSKMNVTYFPYAAKAGNIGLLSHSGTYLCHMYPFLDRRGMGFSEGMSLGNELNVDVATGMEYLGQSEKTKSIALYLETIRRPRKFIEVARKVGKEKPIVAMHLGSSDAGARAASSHTAAMSGKSGVLAGVLDQAGIIRAKGVEQLFDFAGALATLPPLKGKRVAVLTNSGGPGAMTAEALERIGLECPELSAQTQQKIVKMLPHTASARNPVDFTYSTNMNSYYVDVPTILMEDPNIDGVIIYGIFGAGFWEKLAQSFQKQKDTMDIEPLKKMANYFYDSLALLPKKYGKPLVAISLDGFADDAVDALRGRDIPVLPSPEKAAEVMECLYRYHKIKSRP